MEVVMNNIIIEPVIIEHETDKAVLLSSLYGLWLPKAHIVIKRKCVVSVASWLFFKYKEYLTRTKFKTIEELEEWWDYENKILKIMATDKTLQRCKRCGSLFRCETHQRYCENCNVDHAINLQHSAKFGFAKNQMREAAHYGIAYEP
jgi:hypothetical protein